MMHFVKMTLEENSVVRMINLCNVTNITYTTYEDDSDSTILINYVDGRSHIFSGRCAKAVYGALSERLNEIFSYDRLKDTFNTDTDGHITLYGEGFGYKIQSFGNKYNSTQADFILFDVKIGNWWLQREDVEHIADQLDIKVVPIMGYMTIMEAIKFVDEGFKSTISEDKDLNAEGLVLKTPDNLLMRDGERIVLKLKSTDFRKFRATYGDDAIKYTQIGNSLILATSVEQSTND